MIGLINTVLFQPHLILDLYTKHGLAECYLGVYTICFDMQTRQLKQFFLALEQMTPAQSHDFSHIQAKLDVILLRYGLHGTTDIDYLITDNGANVVKAFEHLAEDIDDDDLLDEGLCCPNCSQ